VPGAAPGDGWSGHAASLLSFVTVTFHLSDDPGNSPLGAEHLRLHSCIRRVRAGTRTMMQPCASTAKFRAAGPFSETAWKPCLPRVTATSERCRGPSTAGGEFRLRACCPRPDRLGRRTQNDRPWRRNLHRRRPSPDAYGQNSRDRTSSATAPCLPDAVQTALACGRPRDLPVPAQGACAPATGSDRAGSSAGSRWRRPPYCLPLSRRRRHPEPNFRGSMADLCVSLPTLRRAPRGARRMARGRCGSLLFTMSDSHRLLLAGLPAHRDSRFGASSAGREAAASKDAGYPCSPRRPILSPDLDSLGGFRG
jgi:hypothetical protein